MTQGLKPARQSTEPGSDRARVRTRAADTGRRRPDRVDTVRRPRRREWRIHVWALLLTAACVTWMMELWSVDWTAPFYYTYDAQGSAAHFVTTIETGWYENQPRLGWPYGQHYHDFPFSDDLHPFMAKVMGWLTFGNWVAAFNGYYLLTFLLVTSAAVWFLRQVGLSPAMTVVLATLYSVSPYHWQRNETHLFLSGYYMIPLAMVVVLWVARGEPLWTRRRITGTAWWVRPVSLLTGRGALVVVILGLLVYSGVYYAVFAGLLLFVMAWVAFAGHRSWRRLRGAAVAGFVTVLWFALALLPDLLYARTYGSNSAAYARVPDDAQYYALRIFAMLLPATDHPVPEFAEFRNWFTDRFPPQAEYPTLGLVASAGFLLLIGIGLGRMVRTGDRPVRPGTARARLGELSGLTIIATLIATAGGLGLLLSLATTAMRGWNRMSIFIALFALAAIGLALQNLAVRLRRRLSALDRPRVGQIVAVFAFLTLLLGVADQSLTRAVPDPTLAASFHRDHTFFTQVEASLPAGSAVFQLPFRQYPEGPYINGSSESDQLRALMHTKTLKFSGGGIKGRPQTDWPAGIVDLPTSDMVEDLAIIGFSGIIVDRNATPDLGVSWTERLTAVLGPPTVVSGEGRWVFFPMGSKLTEVALRYSPQERAIRARQLTLGATDGPQPVR